MKQYLNIKKIVLTSVLLAFSASAWAGGILHRGNGAEPGTIDPHFATGTWENSIISDMFMGLTAETADGKIISGLAESWKISKDNKTYTFKIRDAKWSDNTKITAHDFEFSFKRMISPKTAAKYAFILYPIKNAEKVNRGELDISKFGVKALDDSTLQIQLDSITPYFLEQLTHYTTYALPKHVILKHGKNWTKKQNIVVSSAFILDDWKPQTSLTLKKNKNSGMLKM